MSAFIRTELPTSFPEEAAIAMQRRPTETLERMTATGGDLVATRLGSYLNLLLTNPDLIKELLTAPSGVFTKAPALMRTEFMVGEGLLTNENPKHRRHRRLMFPAFHHKRLQEYAATMVKYATRLGENWDEGEVFDLDHAMIEVTLEVVGEALFGARLAGAASTISEAMETGMKLLRRRMLSPDPDWFAQLSPADQDGLRQAREDIDHVVLDMIRARRGAGPRHGEEERTDLLALLLAAQDEETGQGLSDEEVRDEVISLFLAGHETTANALMWTWALLAEHPEVEARLHAEVDAVLGGRAAAFEDVRRLVYTRQVFAEAMRLYPPVWIVSRQAAQDTMLGGHEIAAGTILSFSPYTLHRDARLWDDAERFAPERFSSEASAGRHKFAYLPFSAGIRGCIGEQFAWTEGVLVTATLAQRWRLRRTEDKPLRLYPTLTLRPRGTVPVVAHRREAVATATESTSDTE